MKSALDGLRQQLMPWLPGVSVVWLPECDSTNAQVLARLREDANPCLLITDQQSAGRGRLGRRWHSAPGASLTFSLGVVLPAALSLAGLSLAVGCALADAVEPLPSTASASNSSPRIGLKWPNDVWLDGAKLGGILIETLTLQSGRSGRGVVIGVGLNLAPWPQAGDEVFASGYAALSQLGPDLDAPAALRLVAPALAQALGVFEAAGFAASQAAFARRDLTRDAWVQLGEHHGQARGVSASGELLLQTDAGMRHLAAGELSLRPRAAVKP